MEVILAMVPPTVEAGRLALQETTGGGITDDGMKFLAAAMNFMPSSVIPPPVVSCSARRPASTAGGTIARMTSI